MSSDQSIFLHIRYAGLIQLLTLIKHLNMSDVWLGVDLRTDAKRDTCLKVIRLYAYNLLTIPGSEVNIISGDVK